jgi:hypothetical protein
MAETFARIEFTGSLLDFDAVELLPMRYMNGALLPTDEAQANAWMVALHYRGEVGGIESVADFSDHDAAMELAASLEIVLHLVQPKDNVIPTCGGRQ